MESIEATSHRIIWLTKLQCIIPLLKT